MSCLPRYRAAQHAAGADAAARRQDRGYFDSWYQLGGFPDLLVGAAQRQAVGPGHSHAVPRAHPFEQLVVQ